MTTDKNNNSYVRGSGVAVGTIGMNPKNTKELLVEFFFLPKEGEPWR